MLVPTLDFNKEYLLLLLSLTIIKGDSKYGDDYLEFREFRLFLQTLRATFEFYQAFNTIDLEGDHRISKEEFCNEEIK